MAKTTEINPMDYATNALLQMMDNLSNPEEADKANPEALINRSKALNMTVSQLVSIQAQKDNHVKTQLAVVNTAADLGIDIKPQELLKLE